VRIRKEAFLTSYKLQSDIRLERLRKATEYLIQDNVEFQDGQSRNAV